MSSRISAETVRANYERIRGEVGEGVTVVAATKYVSPEEMEALAAAGIPVVGENRLQDLEAKHARFGDRFRWHFIGHLQSRKARDVSALCELVHSLVLPRAARAGAAELPAGAFDGDVTGLSRGCGGGCDARSGGFRTVRALTLAPVMGVGQVWSRALVYFGIVEEDEYWDEEAYAAEEDLERTYDRGRQNVRRLSPRS